MPESVGRHGQTSHQSLVSAQLRWHYVGIHVLAFSPDIMPMELAGNIPADHREQKFSVHDSAAHDYDVRGYNLHAISDELREIMGFDIPDGVVLRKQLTFPADSFAESSAACHAFSAIGMESASALHGIARISPDFRMAALWMKHTVEWLAVYNDTDADSGAHGDVEHILFSFASTESALANACGIDIAIDGDGNVKPGVQRFCETAV